MKLTLIIIINLLFSSAVFAQTKPKKAKTNKEVIADYPSGLAIIKQINPVKYKKKPEKIKKVTYEVDSLGKEHPQVQEETIVDEKTYIGITAEDVHAVAPDLVTKYINEEGEEALAIEHNALTYLLINAVKEQQVLIEELQTALKLKKE